MFRTILLAILAAVSIIGLPATASADPDATPLGDKLRSNSTIQEMVVSYSELVDQMLVANGLPTANIQSVATPADVTKTGQIALDRANLLLHDESYGSRFSLAFEMGQIALGAVAKAKNAAVPQMEVLAYWNGCYGGAAMRAFGQVTGLSPVDEQMTKVNNLLRAEYGDELAKVVVAGRTTALSGGIPACNLRTV